MSLELATLFSAALIYLLLLFLIAHVTDRGMVPERWVAHPLTYTLSLGVYATSWSYYGSVGFAATQGYQFLTIYLGVTLAFALTPVLLEPILRLARDYQLSSLADLFAFRYRSQLAGALVTLFMLVGSLPYIALQIRAVTESLQVLTAEAPPHILALGFCATLTLFAILFGARHISPREKHRGLVAAIAFESLIKLIALLSVGAFALFGIFGGPGGLSRWLADHPQAVTALYQPVQEGPWLSLLFLAFAAAFLLPRQFHMAFAENLSPQALRTASWAFPLFLLLLNLPIPVLLWGGQALGLEMNPDYFALGVILQRGPDWLALLVFVGGVSAASAMVIVTTLALASMSLNHLLLPASYPDPGVNLYRWLLWGRRVLIGLIILAGYGFYTLLEHQQGLVQLGLLSFVAVAQFVPGIVGLLYWHRATRAGFVSGLLAGIVVWSLTLLLPILASSGIVADDLGMVALQQGSGLDRWSFATLCSLFANGLLFVAASLAGAQRSGEREAALACCADVLQPLTGVVAARSPQAFREGLAQTLGAEAAEREVGQALRDLGLPADEGRAAELRLLRERIERNLSGLLGPQLAHMIVDQRLALDAEAKTALADSVRYVESRLEASRHQLNGLNAELDMLRRYHRQVLLELPLGVCAVSHDRRVVIWNLAMELLSGVSARRAQGRQLQQLPAPWNTVLSGFAGAEDSHIPQCQVALADGPHTFNLHKARIMEPAAGEGAVSQTPGWVMLIEDLTDLERLQAELAHNERLASIGRLAAGVAHEIGNPVTGIASLAQNLREEADPAVLAQSIDDILDQTRRITDIVRALMDFSRSGSPRMDHVTLHLGEVIADALQLVKLTHRRKELLFVIDNTGNDRLNGDRQRLTQVFVNLLTNAGDASPQGGLVEIGLHREAGRLVVEIRDQGPGIPEGLRDKVFEPFVTSKAAGEGTGLGLSLVYKFVLDHGGDIELDSSSGQGTRAVVSLPAGEG